MGGWEGGLNGTGKRLGPWLHPAGCVARKLERLWSLPFPLLKCRKVSNTVVPMATHVLRAWETGSAWGARVLGISSGRYPPAPVCTTVGALALCLGPAGGSSGHLHSFPQTAPLPFPLRGPEVTSGCGFAVGWWTGLLETWGVLTSQGSEAQRMSQCPSI